MTLADLCQEYLADVRCERAASTHYHQQTFFAAVVRERGALPLDAITPPWVRAWKATMAQRLKPATVARYMGYLGAALRYGVACDYLAEDPMRQVRKPSPGPGRVRFLRADERQRLLVACRLSRNPALYSLVVLALSTGGRKNELRYLRWPDVDLATGVVRFVKTKTHLDRAVPLLGEARTLLETLAARRHPSPPLIFAREDGRKPWDIEGAWTSARRMARLTDVHFHDLRHTFASYLAMSGASLRDIAEVLGHTKIQQTMVYAHLLESHTRGVVARMVQTFLA